MSAYARYDPMGSTGYPLDQLASAFDRVRDLRDWQAPIWAVIMAAERPLVAMAVRWFTDTEPVFEPVPGSTDLLVIKAPGFRQGLAIGDSDPAFARPPAGQVAGASDDGGAAHQIQ